MSVLRHLSGKVHHLRTFQRFYQVPTAPHIIDVERPKRPSYFDGGSLYYNIAVPADKDMVMEFMLNHFRKDGPFEKAMSATEEELVDFYSDIVTPCLASGLSVLAFDGNELKSMQLGYAIDIPNDNKQLDFNDPAFTAVKPDFSEDIKNGPYKCEKVNQMYAYVSALQRDFIRIFPPNRRVFVIEIAIVTRDMRGKSITIEMGIKAIRHSQEHGCHFVLTTAISPILAKMVKSESHHKVARTLLFKDFKANGVPVFGDKMQGGGALIFGEYAEMSYTKYPRLCYALFVLRKFIGKFTSKHAA